MKNGTMTARLDSDLEYLDVDQLAKEAILDINPEEVKSPALKRLIQDVLDDTPTMTGYNRMHNRHNRGR